MTKRIRVPLWIVGGVVFALSTAAIAAESSKEEAKEVKAAPAPATPSLDARLDGVIEEASLSARDREILGWANEFALESGKAIEGWLNTQAISEERLFARLYYPVAKTDPVKYKTDYDALADRDIGPIQEKFLAKSIALSYVVLSDINGYVPTHNQKYSQPLTGNAAVDLVNNRTKRIFMTTVGFKSARSEAPFLLQVNERDNGERALNLSVPIRVRGKHWGAVRFGYRPGDK